MKKIAFIIAALFALSTGAQETIVSGARVWPLTSSSYTAYATAFAGDGQCWLERDGTGTDVSDSATGTISFWIDPTGSDTGDFRIWSTNSRISVDRQGGSDLLRIKLVNTSGGTEIQLDQNSGAVSTLNAAGGWSWVGISWDNNTAGACYIYIANASTSWVATDCTTRTDDSGGGANIDWTDSEWCMGASNGGGGLHMPANISEFYMSASYYDFSQAASRDIFYNATTHKPAGDLTSVGSPVWYFQDSYSTFTANSGSGGNMVKKGTTDLASATAP